jgi:uncharacterized protein YjbI with pentapeptide repeats
MKVVKPLKIGLLFRTFESEGRQVLAVTALCLVNPGKETLLDGEPDLWKMVAAELGKEAILDMGLPKPHGEVLVSGSYYAPQGQPVTAGQVTARLGVWQKQLYVFGDRYWYPQAGLWGISDPKPMTCMPLTWATAFGGPQFKWNPLGKGAAPVVLPSGQGVHPLPNIESPENLIRQKSDQPAPAGFGPLDITWPQRFAKAGTYGRQWLAERFPGYAADMDWSIFNSSLPDQQWNGYLNGDELFGFENMHPDNPIWQAQLPGLRLRCFAEQVVDGEPQFKALSSRLDTAWFFPHLQKVLLIYRSVLEVADEEAADINHLLLACEGADDPPRGEAHYQSALSKRLDKENGHLYALNEAELLPLGERSTIADLMDSAPSSKSLLDENMANRIQREKEAAVQKLISLGLDPNSIIKAPDPQPEIDLTNLEKLPAVIAQLTRQAEEKKKEMEHKAREQLERLGLDPQAVREAAEKQTRRWPKFSAQENIARLRSFGIDDPAAEAQLRDAEVQVTQSVRPVVHHLPATYMPAAQDRERLVELVLNGKERGRPLRDVDLAYADLSDRDLSGVDLSGAYLEGADFTGSKLCNADLRQAILTRARFDGADLSGADLTEANLGHAELSATRMTRAVLNGAVLAECNANNCTLDDADFTGADFTGAAIQNCDLSRSCLKGVMFIETRLSGSRFTRADLSEAMFLQTELAAIDFSEANLAGVNFVEVSATKACFTSACLHKSSMAGECDFQGTDFTGAIVTEANLRGCNLAGALFKNADISHSDLSECRLAGADFSLAKAFQTQMVKADLTGARMIAVNLMEGSLQKATLHESDFRAANLYSVDFMGVKFRNTDLRDANVKKAFLERWIPKNP